MKELSVIEPAVLYEQVRCEIRDGVRSCPVSVEQLDNFNFRFVFFLESLDIQCELFDVTTMKHTFGVSPKKEHPEHMLGMIISNCSEIEKNIQERMKLILLSLK